MRYFFLLLSLLFVPFLLQATDCNDQEIPIIITVVTADFASDTFWELTDDDSGELYGTSGFFLVDNTTYIDTICVPDGSNLTFTVTCCVNNMGSYKLEMLGVTIAENGNFQFKNEISFVASELPELDLELSEVNLPVNVLKGLQVIAGKVTNLGSTPIERFDLNWRLGTQTFTQTIEGLDLKPFETYTFEHQDRWKAAVEDEKITVFLTKINGGDDNSFMNNSQIKEVEVSKRLSERTVLYESFTNASCSTCAVADPNFVGTVLGNTKIAAISYHTNFPGFDVMYDESPVDVDARLQYHEVFGVPFSIIEGGLLRDPTQFILSANVNAFRTKDALIHLAVVERGIKGEDGTFDKVVLDVYLTPTSNISSESLRLQTAITEREVLYQDSPGTNGLTEFYYVMRKMLPNANGTPLENLQAYETQHFSFEYEIADFVKNKEELRSVVFVEDSSTKSILQALRGNETLGKNKETNLQKLGASFGYLTAQIQHNFCSAAANGQIEIELFGETEGLEILWSNGETAMTINNLTAGIYGLQITTPTGMVENYDFEIFAPEGFDIEVSSLPETAGNANGSASVEIIGGQSPFSFEWNTGDTTANIEGLTMGTYEVTVTDAFGCQQMAEVMVDGLTDIGDLDLGEFLMYPNPVSNGQLRVKYDLQKEGVCSCMICRGEKFLEAYSLQTSARKY